MVGNKSVGYGTVYAIVALWCNLNGRVLMKIILISTSLSQSHLAARLQSTLGASLSQQPSMYDIRKIGQSAPSKPIVPEFCLEHIWMEDVNKYDLFLSFRNRL